eukprot:COSAG01_NODE_5246_length_4387_cov_10.017724_3_plen_164_part_00
MLGWHCHSQGQCAHRSTYNMSHYHSQSALKLNFACSPKHPDSGCCARLRQPGRFYAACSEIFQIGDRGPTGTTSRGYRRFLANVPRLRDAFVFFSLSCAHTTAATFARTDHPAHAKTKCCRPCQHLTSIFPFTPGGRSDTSIAACSHGLDRGRCPPGGRGGCP